MEREVGLVQPTEGEVLALSAETAATGPYNGAHMRLFNSTFSPGPENVAADFAAAEMSYTGYALQALTWSAVGVGSDAHARSVGNRAFFQATGATPGALCGGFWVERPAAAGPPAVTAAVLAFGVFNPPIDMSVALEFLGITPVLQANGPLSADVES